MQVVGGLSKPGEAQGDAQEVSPVQLRAAALAAAFGRLSPKDQKYVEDVTAALIRAEALEREREAAQINGSAQVYQLVRRPV